MSDSDKTEHAIPLVEERVTIDKRVVETGRVRIRSVVDEKLVRVSEELERDDVVIERIAINREVTEPPRSREEDGVLIVPILEEVVVLEKRLVLKEELHIHRNRKREQIDAAVRLKTMRAEVERVAPEREPEPQPTARGARLNRKKPLLQRRR
jgi:uncharacterized protein (TIGR02271 family)